MESKTTKEYAQDLINMFKPYVHGYVGSSMLTNYEYPDQIDKQARRCALLSLNNTIDNLKKLNEKWHDSEYAVLTSFFDYEIDYLEDVKQEIEKK